jgi:methionyl-tRNA synthetase
MKRLLVTSALPYANGHLHLGHMVEYIQTDVWVRAMRLAGRRVVYVCADDTHGTAIMIRARQEGRSPEAVIADMSVSHQEDFAAFGVTFDHYGSTHSDENRAFSELIWGAFVREGLVKRSRVQQLFDPVEKLFLADRFVKGTCPNCKAPDQYGDNCEKCGATYEATELGDPRSTISGAKPELAESDHLLIDIERERPWLTEITQADGFVPKEIANYLMGFFLGQPLHTWDVSRPAPYFGFEIPDAPGNYFYVWFDAPIGYLAATAQWAEKVGERLDDWVRSDEVDVVHVIGKDIVKFHTLFWPVMLKLGGFYVPKRVQVHGFLTVNGQKMSKRDGTFVLASTFRKHLDVSALRYFYATKLSPKVDDLDLNLDDFVQRVNAELVNKVVNLVSRTSKFLASGFADAYPDDGGLFANGAAAAQEIREAYEGWDFARVTRLAMALADRANEFVDRAQPWALAKQADKGEEVRRVATIAMNLFRQIVIYLAPIVPVLADRAADLLGAPIRSFDDAKTPLTGSPVGTYQHFMKRIDPEAVTRMVEESKPQVAAAAVAEASVPAAAPAAETPVDSDAALAKEPLAPVCSIDDFTKIDLRVARIVQAEAVPEAKKLLKLTVSLGGEHTRTVFAGIKAYYKAEDLVGRLVIVCANLAPRQMKFGLSEGMVLAAGAEGEAYVLAPDSGARPGQRVH